MYYIPFSVDPISVDPICPQPKAVQRAGGSEGAGRDGGETALQGQKQNNKQIMNSNKYTQTNT